MTHDEVRKRAKDEGIEFFLAQFVDMHGKPNAKLMPVQAIDDLLEEGAGLRRLRRRPDRPDARVARHARRARTRRRTRACRGSPSSCASPATSRSRASRGRTARARSCATPSSAPPSSAISMKMGLEAEFFLVRKDERRPAVVDDPLDTRDQPCYDAKALYRNYEFLTTLSRYANELGCGNYANDHEDANGQFESNFAYDDALVTCDRGDLLPLHGPRHGAAARQARDVHAEAVRPPDRQRLPLPHLAVGPGGRDEPLRRPDRPARLRALRRSPTTSSAACIDHAEAVSAIVAPTVNSYKRIGVGAPDLGRDLVAGVRGLGRQQPHADDPRAGRPAHRASRDRRLGQPVPRGRRRCSPPGLDGIERKLDPGERNTAQPLHDAARGGRGASGIKRLPAHAARRRARTCARTPSCATGSATRAREHYIDYFAKTKIDEFNALPLRGLAVGGRPLPDAVLGPS